MSMNIIDLLVLSFESLKERKVRTTLTIAMVVIGAALVTGLNGLSEGMSNYMESQFGLLGANTIIALPASESFRLTEQVCSSIRQIRGVEAVIPYIYTNAVIKSGGRSQDAIIIGIDQTKLNLVFPTIELAEGSLVPPYDSNGVVLGDLIAHPKGEPTFAECGQAVTIEYRLYSPSGTEVVSRSFRVRGILSYMGATSRLLPIDRTVLISLAAANSFFERGGAYDGVYIVADDERAVDVVVEEITNIYGEQMELYSAKSIIEIVRNIMSGFQIFTSSIATVSLIVAAVGIFTGLYTSVMERTREIGVLKALGFSNWMVLVLFLNDALVIGMIGGAIGNGAGVLVAYALSIVVWRWRGWRGLRIARAGAPAPFINPAFSPQLFIFVWCFCVLLSAFAGVYPAWRASKLDPVVALRKE